jgi:hypothetical protein
MTTVITDPELSMRGIISPPFSQCQVGIYGSKGVLAMKSTFSTKFDCFISILHF